ncbi:AraC family transcriptional regulator Rsp [Staphylococcus shinii]|uniref:AraC family transcriptional regulator Rsp n=1 Tax=Staphylococcus shinii TaxID=2912228 RepID=UPI00298EFE98|nr:AraC family transcriptional regulator Rsp [Staphylococcus shinii]MDW8569189.1 AraC family transcriptional regulator Rsp [Staphylococcus shinii]MDW8572227.1 AraC family transcriptional regulator Rsp [Staphylococcus shinii]
MKNTTLCIHEFLNTHTQRCIHQVIILFSLNNKLDVTLNGHQLSAENHIIIINHNDLYHISDAEQVVEMCIPIQQFTKTVKSFFNFYYNYKLLNSNEYLKFQILTMIQQLSQCESIESPMLNEIITIINKETRVEHDFIYIPSIHTENTLLNNITDFIKAHVAEPLSSKDVSSTFYISAPYISILFKKYLGISFKHYITSLKIALSLADLIQTKHAIYHISEHYGFNHYSNYIHQFKFFLNITPNEFRKSVHNLHQDNIVLINNDLNRFKSQIDIITKEKPGPLKQLHIDIEQLDFKDWAKTPTIFIHIDSLMDIIQSDLNSKLNFKDLTDAYVLINNVRNFSLENLSLTGMIDFIDSLFSDYVGIALRIKSMTQFDFIEGLISQFLKFKPEYAKQQQNYNFLILFDASHLSLKDVNRLYIKIKNLNFNIKMAITIEGVIQQVTSLKHAFTLLQRFNFDYHFIDIEQVQVRKLLNKKGEGFNNSMSYYDYYNKVIKASHIDTSKFVYTKLTKQCFKFYEEHYPLEITDLMCHILILLNRGCGVGYELMRKEKDDVALMNSHGIYEPLMYLYQFIKPFIGKAISIHKNFIMLKERDEFHLLLFNSINHRTSPKDVLNVVLKQSLLNSNITLFIQTLNREHGFIDYALPPSFNDIYIERSLLRYIEQSTIPKAEIRQFTEFKSSLEFILHYDELKYIRILQS